MFPHGAVIITIVCLNNGLLDPLRMALVKPGNCKRLIKLTNSLCIWSNMRY